MPTPDDARRVAAFAAALDLRTRIGSNAAHLHVIAYGQGIRDAPSVQVGYQGSPADRAGQDRSRLDGIRAVAAHLGLQPAVDDEYDGALNLTVPGATASGHPVHVWTNLQDPDAVAEARRLYAPDSAA
jgi:hypothetical protein